MENFDTCDTCESKNDVCPDCETENLEREIDVVHNEGLLIV